MPGAQGLALEVYAAGGGAAAANQIPAYNIHGLPNGAPPRTLAVYPVRRRSVDLLFRRVPVEASRAICEVRGSADDVCIALAER